MKNLICKIAREFKLQVGVKGFTIIHREYDLLLDHSSASKIDGILVEGLWYGAGGKIRRTWEREPVLKSLKEFAKQGFLVLLAEFPLNRQTQERILCDSKYNGFDPVVTSIPISVN